MFNVPTRADTSSYFAFPEVKTEGLIPINPELDTFTRPKRVYDRSIMFMYKMRPKKLEIIFDGLESQMKFPSDDIVLSVLNQEPELVTAVSSLITY